MRKASVPYRTCLPSTGLPLDQKSNIRRPVTAGQFTQYTGTVRTALNTFKPSHLWRNPQVPEPTTPKLAPRPQSSYDRFNPTCFPGLQTPCPAQKLPPERGGCLTQPTLSPFSMPPDSLPSLRGSCILDRNYDRSKSKTRTLSWKAPATPPSVCPVSHCGK